MEYFLGTFLGFVTYCITAGEEGDYSRSIRIYGIHIHHWMYLTVPLIFSLIVETSPYFVGFCIGGIIHGITMYSDAFEIFY